MGRGHKCIKYDIEITLLYTSLKSIQHWIYILLGVEISKHIKSLAQTWLLRVVSTDTDYRVPFHQQQGEMLQDYKQNQHSGWLQNFASSAWCHR